MGLEEKMELIKYCPECKVIRAFHKLDKKDSDIYSCSGCKNSFSRNYIINYDSGRRSENFRQGFGSRRK